MPAQHNVLALLAALASAALPAGASAYVLEDVANLSAIGRPLRVEITLVRGSAVNAAACLKAIPANLGDGLPPVLNAEIRPSPSHSGRIEVTTRTPVMEPVLRLRLVDVCHSRIQRDFVLLLPFAQEPVRAPTVGRATRTGPERLARPAPPALERGPAPPHAAHTPAVHAPTPPVEPGTGRSASLSVSDGTGRIPIAEAAQRPPPRNRDATPTPPPTPDDRLQLAAPPVDGKRSSDPSEREKQVLAALDDQLARQLELSDRINRLNATQQELKAELTRLNELTERMLTLQLQGQLAGLAPPAGRQEAAAPAPDTPPLPDNVSASPPAAEATPGGSVLSGWLSWALLILVVTAAGYLAFSPSRNGWTFFRRRNNPLPAKPKVSEVLGLHTSPPPAPPAAPNPATGARPQAPAAPAAPPAAPAQGRLPISLNPTQQATFTALPSAEDFSEEHDSAVELAEIMMSFGRVHGAAETLAEFIRSNPRQSVAPWLKLLDVYRAGNMSSQFDTLAKQLNKTFNVMVVTWENYDQMRRSTATVEQMPHIVRKLQETWRTRECQAYLKDLILDNREGTRQGFPLPVVDELLTLSGMLELELGAYRDKPVIA